MSLIALNDTPALSEDQQGFLAWTKLEFNQATWKEIERLLKGEQSRFRETSTVDEHRIRQEARKRSISLPR